MGGGVKCAYNLQKIWISNQQLFHTHHNMFAVGSQRASGFISLQFNNLRRISLFKLTSCSMHFMLLVDIVM